VLDTQWDEAIRLAPSDGRRARVFVERREDLAVDAASGEDPEVRRTVWTGAAVEQADHRFCYHSDVDPEDLASLIAGRPPAAQHSRTPASLLLDPQPALAAVVGAVVEAQRGLPAGVFGASWVQSEQSVLVGDAAGVIDDRRRTCSIRLEGSLRRGDREARASAERTVEGQEVPVSSLVEPLIERLEARLDAEDPHPGPTDVVFAPSIGGIWIHELVGHAAEADRVLRRGSWLAETDVSFSRELHVIDDPRRGRGAWRFDDEGTPSGPVALIHEGRPQGLLHTCGTASTSGQDPTGHGRRSSYRERVIPRMGCTFIANGNRHPNEILENVRRGVYVRRMESASTDTATGRAVFRVTDADVIREGRVETPLRSHLLETFASSGLSAIDGIANDLAFDHCIGLCHREGQPLSTSVGAPTICTRLMTVRR
jgi:TldD protein